MSTPPALGLYVHWPYCARICPYCDFNVYRARGADTGALTAAILDDIARWRARTGARRLTSLHFGGGTPSLMPPGDIAAVIEAADRLFGFENGAEIGLEANPKEAARLPGIASAGVERVSVGVQAFDDASLAALGRDHGAEEALAAVADAQDLFARVSIDLIYAREGQTPDGWRAELERAVALGLDHLSLYQLTIEPGTAFARKAERGALIPPASEDAAEMFEIAQNLTATAGLQAYEISNHARGAANRSVHNRLYWTGGDWIGAGPGAHSRLGRHSDGGRLSAEAAATPGGYAAGVAEGGGHETAVLTALEEAQERVLMGLRIAEGLDRADLRGATGLDIDMDAARRFEAQGMLTLHDDRAAITPAGRLYADRISMELAPG